MKAIAVIEKSLAEDLITGAELKDIKACVHPLHTIGVQIMRNDLKYRIPLHLAYSITEDKAVVEIYMPEIQNMPIELSEVVLPSLTKANVDAVYSVHGKYDNLILKPKYTLNERALIKYDIFHAHRSNYNPLQVKHRLAVTINDVLKPLAANLNNSDNMLATLGILRGVVNRGTIGRKHYQQIVNHLADFYGYHDCGTLNDIACELEDEYSFQAPSQLEYQLIIAQDFNAAHEEYMKLHHSVRKYALAQALAEYFKLFTYTGSHQWQYRKAFRQYYMGELSAMIKLIEITDNDPVTRSVIEQL